MRRFLAERARQVLVALEDYALYGSSLLARLIEQGIDEFVLKWPVPKTNTGSTLLRRAGVLLSGISVALGIVTVDLKAIDSVTVADEQLSPNVKGYQPKELAPPPSAIGAGAGEPAGQQVHA